MRRVSVIVTITWLVASCASLPFLNNTNTKPSAEAEKAQADEKAASEKAAQEKARANFDSAYAKLNGLMDGIKTSTPTVVKLDIAKGDLIIVRAMLTSSTSWGPPTAELRVFTESVSVQLSSYNELLKSSELAAQVHEYKGLLAEAAMQIQTDIGALKTSTQTLALVQRIESNFKQIAQIKIKSAKLEQQNADYKAFIAKVQTRLLDLQNDFSAKRDEIYLTALRDVLKATSRDLKAAVKRLKANPKLASNFEGVQAILKLHNKAIVDARASKDHVAALNKDILASEGLGTNATKQLGQFQLSYDIAAQKREVQQAIEALKAITTSFATAKDIAVFDKGEKALHHVESVLTKGKAFEAKNPAYASFANGVRLGMKRGHAGIKTAKAKWPVRQQTVRLEEAVASMNASLAALKKTPSEANITKLQTSLSAVNDALAAGKTFESKDLKYLRFAIAQRKVVRKQEAGIKKARANLKVFQQKQAVVSASKIASEQSKSAKDEAAFSAAQTAVNALSKVLGQGKAIEAKDANYLKYATKQRKLVKKFSASIKAAQQKATLASKRAQIEKDAAIAKEKVSEAMASKNYADAEAALQAIEKNLSSATMLEEKSPKYKKFANAQRKLIAKHKSSVAAARLKTETNEAQIALETATAEADAVVASATDEAAYKEAESKIVAVEKILGKYKALEKKSPRYQKLAKSKRSSAAAHKKTIASFRQKSTIEAARIAIEGARANLEESVAAASDAATFQAAENAGLALQKALKSNAGLGKKDKAFSAFIKASTKSLTASRALILKKQGAARIETHRLALESAQAEAEGQVAALTSDSAQVAYQKAANAVSAFNKVLESGMTLGDSNPKYAKYLAKAQANKNRLRATIPRRRIKVAKNAAEIALTQLAAGSEGAYETAKSAVEAFVSVTKSNQSFSGAGPEYKKFVKKMMVLAKSMSRSLVKQRFESVERIIETNLAVLAAQPESEAYGPIESAIRQMSTIIREYESDPKRKAMAAKRKSKLESYKGKLIRYRVSGISARAKALIGALDESSVLADFSEAKEVITSLSDLIEETESDIGADKKLAKFLAKTEAMSKKLRKKLERQKTTATLRPEFDKMKIAITAAKEQVGLLSSSDTTAKQIEDAKASVDAAETVVFDASKHDSKSSGFAKKRAKHQKTIDGLKRKLAARERAQARATNQIEVEQAVEKAEAAVAAVESSLDLKVLDQALASVTSARSTVRGGNEFKANKKYAKYLGAKRAALAGLESAALRSYLSNAATQMKLNVVAVSADSDLAAFGAAADAIDAYAEVIKKVEAKAKKSKKLKVLVSKAKKRLPANRTKLAKMRVEAAARAVDAQMEILRGSKSPEALDMARATNDVLAKTLKAHGKAFKAGKGKKKLKALKKSIKANRKVIARYDFDIKTRPHRQKIKAATESAKASLELLKAGSLDEKSFAEADRSVAALATVVEAVPVMARGNKKYSKSLRAFRKRVRSYQSKINRYRYTGKIKIHKVQVAEAKSNAKAAVKALGSASEASDYRTAEAAVADLDRIVRDGEELADKDRKYAKYLAAARKLKPKLKGQITAKRLKGSFINASKKLKRLEKSPTAEGIADAASAIEEAQSVVKIVSSYGKGGKSEAKALKAAKKKIRRYRVSLARARTKARFRLLTKKSEPEAYLATEEAIDELREIIKSNKRFAKKDPKLKRLLKEAKQDVPRFRVRIKQRQIEAAIGEAKENLAEAKRDPQAIALYEADESISDLEETLSSVKKLAKKNKKFGRFVKSAKKKAKKYRKLLVKVRLKKGSAAGR